MYGIDNRDEEFQKYAHEQNVKNLRYFSLAVSVICALLFFDNSGPIENVKYNHIINYSNLSVVYCALFLSIWLILSYSKNNLLVQKIAVWAGVLSGYAIAFSIAYLDISQGSGTSTIAIAYLMISVLFSARLIYMIALLAVNGAFFYYMVSQIDAVTIEQYRVSLIAIIFLSILVSITLERQRRDVFNSRKKLETKIEELNHALDVKGTFFGHMSHELRTPLNAIIGFSDMLKNKQLREKNSDKTEEYADYINSGGKHLLSLVNDLLDQNKIEAGEVKIKVEKLDINELLKSYIEELEPISRNKNQRLKLSLSGNNFVINSDRRYFKQIIYNVLSNAQKYSPDQSDINIQLTETAQHSIEISIKDNGKGMPAEVVEQIIHPVSPLKSHFISHAEGTGLGLIIVRQLMKRLHGKIRISSEVNIGTIVTLSFPIDF